LLLRKEPDGNKRSFVPCCKYDLARNVPETSALSKWSDLNRLSTLLSLRWSVSRLYPTVINVETRLNWRVAVRVRSALYAMARARFFVALTLLRITPRIHFFCFFHRLEFGITPKEVARSKLHVTVKNQTGFLSSEKVLMGQVVIDLRETDDLSQPTTQW